MAVIFPILFTIYYYFAGLLLADLSLRKHLPKRILLLIAPALGLLYVGIVSLIAYITKLDQLLYICAILVIALCLWRSRALWDILRSVDRFILAVAVIFVIMYVMQSIAYNTVARQHTEAGNTWQLYAASGGVSPPDQSFSWHQARFFLNRLNYPTDEFYGDIDLLDRTLFGGFITYYPGYFFGVPKGPYPDTNFELDLQYQIYTNIWWIINNLYVLGIGLVLEKIFGRKLALLGVLISAISPVAFLLSMGVWAKMFPLYLFSLVLYLHLEKKLPLLQGLLAGMAFHIHGSALLFLLPLGIEDIYELLKRYVADRKITLLRLLYPLKFGAVAGAIILTWFVVVRVYQSPQALTFAYQYNAGWTELRSTDAELLKQRFYETTNGRNRLLLPVINTAKSILPLELFSYIDGFSVTAKDYISFTKIVDVMTITETNHFPSILGFMLMPLLLVGMAISLLKPEYRRYFIFLYVLPTVLIALLYRRDEIILNYITSFYLVIGSMAIIISMIQFEKIRLSVITWLVVITAVIGHILTVMFSSYRIFPTHPWVQLDQVESVIRWWPYLLCLLVMIVAFGYFTRKLKD